MSFPERKKIRLSGYDYSADGMYFITLCVKGRASRLCRGELCSPGAEEGLVSASGEYSLPQLTPTGTVVEQEIAKLSTVYNGVWVEKYRIMPDHVHMLIVLSSEGVSDVRPQLSRVIKQFKGSVTKKLGFSIWQKSFYDEIIRNEEHLQRVWTYIDYNHLKPHQPR